MTVTWWLLAASLLAAWGLGIVAGIGWNERRGVLLTRLQKQNTELRAVEQAARAVVTEWEVDSRIEVVFDDLRGLLGQDTVKR
jgi:hypothetical protein